MREARSVTRRAVIGGALAVAVVNSAASAASPPRRRRIVIVGAGAGGAVAARALKRRLGASAEISVIAGERPGYRAPFLATSVLLGASVPKTVDTASVLARDGLTVIPGRAVGVDRKRKVVRVERRSAPESVPYDILVAAPGIAFGSYGDAMPGPRALEGLCWTDAEGCISQRDAIRALAPGATLVFTAPPQPYRCPPSIYERVCLTAHLLKPENPSAKILIVDEKDQFPMQALFEIAFANRYGGMIEWIPKEFHGGIRNVDHAAGTVRTGGETFRGAFLHAVPPQRAPGFLRDAGLTNERGFCPVVAPSMRSAADPDIYVIGDAADMTEMSKSAVSAAVQGRLAARDIATRVAGSDDGRKIVISDQCWTFLAPDDAVSLGGTYAAKNGVFEATERNVSVADDSADLRSQNAEKARAWPAEMLKQMYGTMA